MDDLFHGAPNKTRLSDCGPRSVITNSLQVAELNKPMTPRSETLSRYFAWSIGSHLEGAGFDEVKD